MVLLSKKGMAPLVATGLLLVVAIMALIAFWTWYEGYFSGYLTEYEDNILREDLEIRDFKEGDLLLRAAYDMKIQELYIGRDECKNDINISRGVNVLRLGSSECLDILQDGDSMVGILIVLDDGRDTLVTVPNPYG